jgi:hypothetical protein
MARRRSETPITPGKSPVALTNRAPHLWFQTAGFNPCGLPGAGIFAQSGGSAALAGLQGKLRLARPGKDAVLSQKIGQRRASLWTTASNPAIALPREGDAAKDTQRLPFVIAASSAGTLIEFYDFRP